MHIIGVVEGKRAVLIDDIVDTAGTITQAVPALLAEGVTEVYAAASHPVLSGPAVERDSRLRYQEALSDRYGSTPGKRSKA